MKKVLLILGAALAGQATLYAVLILVQEVIFGGISYYGSSLFDLVVGGFGSFLAAVASGVVAYLVVKGSTIIPHIIITLLLITESTWLIFYRGTEDPLWFDFVASGSLFVGLWLGVWLMKRR